MTESVVTITTDNDGDKTWELDGKAHREDGPAFEGASGCKAWCINGRRHREDGPAIEYVSGDKEWWLDGVRYTEEEWKKEMNKRPVMTTDEGGVKMWKVNGDLHKEDGPSYIAPNGYKAWHINGRWHRDDGPAIEYPSGDEEWWLDDKRHREDGPAIKHADGNKEWWLDGKEYTEKEWKEKLSTPLSVSLAMQTITPLKIDYIYINDVKYIKEGD